MKRVEVEMGGFTVEEGRTDTNWCKVAEMVDGLMEQRVLKRGPRREYTPCGCHGTVEQVGEFFRCRECGSEWGTRE